MSDVHHTVIGLRTVARAWSLATLVFVALVYSATQQQGAAPAPGDEWVGLLMFPLGVLVGMAIAWWKEFVGGVITLASLAAFYLWHAATTGALPGGPFFLLLAFPGFLFLAVALAERRGAARRAHPG